MPSATRIARSLLDGSLLARLAGESGRRLAWGIVLALCLTYAAGLFAFYPRLAINDDEAMYLRQARLLVEGSPTVVRIHPLTGEESEFRPSTYAVGTAALLAPFIWAAGPRGAFVVPMLALLAGVLLTARWIADEQRSPLFALLALGFVPALVLGRVCMSDTPSFAVVSLGLWLFWRGIGGADPREPAPARGWWLGAGFVAGASLVFRPTNALLFAPLFAGTLLRRERRFVLLLAGGLAGTAVRLVAHALHFGSVFFERATYRFSPETIHERLPLYLFGLLVLFPGGLLAAFAYRGRRRPEIAVTTGTFFLAYLLQAFSMVETGWPRRLVLALRYFIPLLPILAFATAEVAPRWWRARLPADAARRARVERGTSRLLGAALAGLALAVVGVHAGLDRWSSRQARIAEAMATHVPNDRVLVTNIAATRKFLSEVDRRYLTLERADLEPGDFDELLARHSEFTIAFLDRSDSEYFRRNARQNAELIARLVPRPVLELDLQISPIEHLRVWRVTAPRLDGAPPRS
jgi:4-amino-4-deoxy-L-arabinose transferase-like glycosyltransferase